MSIMCDVIMFPQEKRLPKGIENEIDRIAKEYIETLFVTLVLLGGREFCKEELEEVTELVEKTFANGIVKAIEQLGKG